MADLSGFSPFNDPTIRRKQQVTASASFKAFNAVCQRLLVDLSRIFPGDATLRFIVGEFDTLSKDKQKYKVPALSFFREIRKPKKMADGTDVPFVDLLVNKDERAFKEPIPIFMLAGIGLHTKWAGMDEPLRRAVWEYVGRLVHLSAQAVFSSSRNIEEMNKLSRSIVSAAMTGKTGPEELLMDQTVVADAEKFVESIK